MYDVFENLLPCLKTIVASYCEFASFKQYQSMIYQLPFEPTGKSAKVSDYWFLANMFNWQSHLKWNVNSFEVAEALKMLWSRNIYNTEHLSFFALHAYEPFMKMTVFYKLLFDNSIAWKKPSRNTCKCLPRQRLSRDQFNQTLTILYEMQDKATFQAMEARELYSYLEWFCRRDLVGAVQTWLPRYIEIMKNAPHLWYPRSPFSLVVISSLVGNYKMTIWIFETCVETGCEISTTVLQKAINCARYKDIELWLRSIKRSVQCGRIQCARVQAKDRLGWKKRQERARKLREDKQWKSHQHNDESKEMV